MFIRENITLSCQNTNPETFKIKRNENIKVYKSTFEKPLKFQSPNILKNGQNDNKKLNCMFIKQNKTLRDQNTSSESFY